MTATLLLAFAQPVQASFWNSGYMVVGGIAVAVVLVQALASRKSPRQRQLDLLEKALDRSDLSGAERGALAQALRELSQPPRFLRRCCFGLGWMAMFAGGGLLATHEGLGWGSMLYCRWGVALLVGGLALTTLPLALRELERKAGDPRESLGGRS